MESGCISPPIPAAGFTSGASVSRMERPNRSPSARLRKRASSSHATAAPSSRRSARVRAPCGSTTRAADRQITSEGYGLVPAISPDGMKLYYLVRGGGAHDVVSGELWVADLESGQRQRLLPDFLMQHYAISSDGQRIVFVVADDTGHSPVWVAALDGRSAPRRVTTQDGWK